MRERAGARNPVDREPLRRAKRPRPERQGSADEAPNHPPFRWTWTAGIAVPVVVVMGFVLGRGQGPRAEKRQKPSPPISQSFFDDLADADEARERAGAAREGSSGREPGDGGEAKTFMHQLVDHLFGD